MDRRSFLAAALGTAALAALSPEVARAAATPWTLAVADVETDIPLQRLRLIHGRAPADLAGTLFRNGPARFRRPGGSATHWFDGDGLVRAFRIDDGEARMQARFVDTAKRRADAAADAVVTSGFGTPGRASTRASSPDDLNAANTSVLPVGGDVWALWEGGSPIRLSGETLATEGPVTLGPNLGGMPFLAHPRREPDGRVWNLGVSGDRAMVWRLATDGTLEAATPIRLPRASYVHDFTVTARHLIVVLQPWVFGQFRPPFIDSMAWRPELGTQVLVLDKDDLSRRRTWELPAFFHFHLGAAWEDVGGAIRFDVCAAEDPTFAVQGARDILLGAMPRLADLASLAFVTLRPDGRATLERSAVSAEFPQSDPRRAGLRRRLTAHVTDGPREAPGRSAVAVRDWETGTERRFAFDADHLIEEFVFVPRPGREAEGDAWLLGTSLNLRERATELHLFAAGRVDAGPIVSWRADAALPLGFHGAFAPRT